MAMASQCSFPVQARVAGAFLDLPPWNLIECTRAPWAIEVTGVISGGMFCECHDCTV